MNKGMCLVAVMCVGFCPASASGQAGGAQPAQRDSVAATTFDRTFSNAIRGDVSRVFMRNGVSANLILGSGLNVTGNLGIDESHYRLQDRREESRNFVANLNMPLGKYWRVTGSISDARFFNRVVTFANQVQDFTNKQESAQSALTYARGSPTGLSVEASANARVSRSQQTFLKDQNQGGSIRGSVSYVLGDRVKWSGRGFARRTSRDAEASGRENRGLGGEEDSLGTSLRIDLTSGSFVNAHYRRSTSSNEFMDHPRGVFLEQRFSGNLVRETETRMAEVFNASLQADLSANVRLTIGGTHSIADNEYRVAQKRNSTTTVDRLSGAVAYKLGSNATVKARLETSETLHDLGSQSLGSYTDKRQSAKLDIAYPVSSTLQVQLGTGAQLFQNFYKAKDVNPRDRDQLDEYVNLRINSTPFPKVAAAVFLSASQTRYVNIDGSLSQNNRRETTYDFRPEFTYKITERLELKQEYGLNIEFTEFDFTEEDNFLDRNFLFGNTVRAKLTPSLSSTFDYSLLLHDRGSYLRPAPGAERLLDIDQEDRRDQMSIGFRYQINPRLALVGRNDYTIRRDQLAGGSGTSSFEEGGLEVGAEGKYDFGGGRRLVFRLMKVSRFGRFSSPEQEDYWNMDSSLNYPF